MFQFLTVRLRVLINFARAFNQERFNSLRCDWEFVIPRSTRAMNVFQFLTVRLRGYLVVWIQLSEKSFNSLRCDWELSLLYFLNCLWAVSIPYGAIESCALAQKPINRNVSIPYGAIERCNTPNQMLYSSRFNSLRCDWETYFGRVGLLYDWVSIPYGAIESANILNTCEIISLFQFLTVRLRAKPAQAINATFKFQFLTVRLRDHGMTDKKETTLVSIPYGAIESRSTPRSFRLKRVSIPYGAIESKHQEELNRLEIGFNSLRCDWEW